MVGHGMTDQDDDTLGFDEVLDWYSSKAQEAEDEFPGDFPKQGVTALVDSATGLPMILKRAEVYDANEEVEGGPTDEDIAEALSQQLHDIIAAIANIQREYDLDLAETFTTRRAKTDAIEGAESMDELMEAMDEAGLEMEIPGMDGIEVGENVDGPDYDPDDRDRGTY